MSMGENEINSNYDASIQKNNFRDLEDTGGELAVLFIRCAPVLVSLLSATLADLGSVNRVF